MTATTPSVTCIMIFLDGARFIDEAIRSVVAQDADVDWELILVDDGSTDDSTAMAHRWADSDRRIRYLDHDGHANLGMSASRNAGIAAASGDYIGFLDCDDVWLPSALSHGLRVFALHPDAEAVIGGAWRWHGWTGDPADRARDRLADVPDAVTHTLIEPPGLFADIYRAPDGSRVPTMCSVLTDRTGLLRVGGFDDSFRGMYEDQVLYAKIGLHLRSVVDPRPMALYRQHADSACQLAIDSGEWQRVGPNKPLQRYVEWLRAHIAEHAGSDAGSLDIVRSNLDRSTGIDPGPVHTPRSFRRLIPEPVRRLRRTVRDRLRPPVGPTTVVGYWSEQFLAPIEGPIEGRTLVVIAPDDNRPWIDAPPAEAFAKRTTRCPWNVTSTPAARYDRVVVPFTVATAVDTATLIAGVGRLVASDGAVYIVAPGPALDADRPEAERIVELVRSVLPHHRVDVESFGNATTVAEHEAAAASLGPTIDRHDPDVHAVLGISITPHADTPHAITSHGRSGR